MLSSSALAQRRAARPSVRSRTSSVRVCAALRPQSLEKMITRYDWLSTGIGALTVTTCAVARGQPMGEAAGLTVVATIAALVANELLFTPKEEQGGGGGDN